MEIGTLIAGRYVLERQVASGAVGSVFRARDLNTRQHVAVKVLKVHSSHQDRRLARETSLLRALQHPAIVRFIDGGLVEGVRRFLVMEWLDGCDLASRLQRDTLRVDETLALASRVASALSVAHGHRVTHRDVKPGNIFLRDEQVEKCVLIDFGVARWSEATQTFSRPGMRTGTPLYMSPEQVRGERDVGPQSDIFSLGCVLFECLTGRPAFWGRSEIELFDEILEREPLRVNALCPAIPPPLGDLVAHMLAKDAARRPSCAEVLGEVDSLAAALDATSRSWKPALAKEPATARQPVLHHRLLHVVVAMLPADGDDDTDGDGARAATAAPDRDELLTLLEDLDARLEVASDEAGHASQRPIVVVFERTGSDDLQATGVRTDQARNAARCALRLRQAMPSAMLAVSCGVVVSSQGTAGARPSDAPLAALVARTRSDLAELASAGWSSGAIHLDDRTAGSLGPELLVERDVTTGAWLRGEAEMSTGEIVVDASEVPFVGRRRELTSLLRAIDDCRDERSAQVVILTGPPGFGKTRLYRELLDRLERRESDVGHWLVQGGAGSSSLPLVARALDVVGPEADSSKGAEDAGSGVGDGDALYHRLHARLERESEHRPFVVVLDDLQWVDRLSLELVERCMTELAERPLLILAVGRPEYRDVLPDLWLDQTVTEIRLGRLGDRHARTLIRAVMGDDVSEQRVTELVERCQGNPFYLGELIRNAMAT